LDNQHALPCQQVVGIATRLVGRLRLASINRTIKEILMFIANTVGMLMFILGISFAYISSRSFDLHVGYAGLIMGGGWVLVDGLLRLRHRQYLRSYIHPKIGGHMFYIPLWILGAVVMVAMLYGLATDPPGWFTPLPTTTRTAP
jgi:hypothetical protein